MFVGLIHSDKCSQLRYRSVTLGVEISIIKMVTVAQTWCPWVLPLSLPRCLKENQDHGKREGRKAFVAQESFEPEDSSSSLLKK